MNEQVDNAIGGFMGDASKEGGKFCADVGKLAVAPSPTQTTDREAFKKANQRGKEIAEQSIEKSFGLSPNFTKRERRMANAILYLQAARAESDEEIEKLKHEIDEQCRINGMGGERELSLMAQIERLKSEINEVKYDEDDCYEEIQRMRHGIRNALYPKGIKHPQQSEWKWMLEKIAEQTKEIERLKRVVDAAKAILPYADAIICYASTMDEHEPNRLVFNLGEALKAAEKESAK